VGTSGYKWVYYTHRDCFRAISTFREKGKKRKREKIKKGKREKEKNGKRGN